MDHFFYEYRIEQINEFARLSFETVKEANPNIKLSGAIFKNPIHSGRFIGQDWRRFSKYQEIAVPIDYRDHFPGTMEHNLDLLEAAIVRQKEWSKNCDELYIGFAIWPLYKEEPNGPYPEWKLEKTVERIASQNVDGIVMFCDWDIEKFGLESAVRRAFGKISR